MIAKTNYRYPFSFPNTFLTYKNIYDLKVKLEVIQAISKVPLVKVFYVEVFLEQFNVSTKNKAIIKKQIVKTFNQLQTVGIIKNHYKFIKKKITKNRTSSCFNTIISRTSQYNIFLRKYRR